jgi:predicted kinase
MKKTILLTITVGLPASGKTTWALQMGFDVAISLDDCRQELWGDYTQQDGPGGIMALLELQEQKIRAAMAEQKSIVVHNTHHLREFRNPIIALAKDFGYHVQIVYFNVDPMECRRRNRARPNPVPETVMDEFILSLEIPTEDEADEIIVL